MPRAPAAPKSRSRKDVCSTLTMKSSRKIGPIGLMLLALLPLRADAQPPTAVEACAFGPDEIRVFWNKAAGEGTYHILRDGKEIASVAADQTSFIDKTVEPNRTYR